MLNKLELPWLRPLGEAWLGGLQRGRTPHAVLLTGSPGVGKRATATWIAERQLGIEVAPLPEYRHEAPDFGHPDFRRVRPLEGKQAIRIDQIRELVAELSLTSYEGGTKVAIIEPANAMTDNAAASLLKTLEEPPGDTLLLLIADRVGRLPATILSRCQRFLIATPSESVSLEWLNRLHPAANWPAALQVAGHAPLAAIGARERLEITDAMALDFGEVAERRQSPIEVAARWCQHEPDFVLAWMGRRIQQCIHRTSGSRAFPPGGSLAESVLNRMDRRNLFCYLDVINRVRGQPAGSFNVQLTLEGLLIDWAEGLKYCGNEFIGGGVLPIPTGR
ncbi:MAG: hypothetical protein ACREQ1_06460 [Woeseiaceae bacterium]